jgi:hypothetical protein
MAMRNLSTAPLLSLFILAACGEGQQSKKLQVTAGANFFENSRRVDANAAQKRGLARLRGCTGFFLKNAQNKNLIATARHCFSYNAPEWCATGIAKDEASGTELRCKSVAAGDSRHDLVVLEFEDAPRDRTLDFELATFPLTKDLRLEMLGFPGDLYNSARALKLTQNCWVIEPKTRNIYDDPNVADDKTFTHNCSTYGGNSGGPMFIEGTRIAIGIPDTYAPNDFSQRARNERAAQGVLAADFAADFAEAIANYQVVTRASVPAMAASDYPLEGIFRDDESCQITVQKISYNTSIKPTEMTVSLAEGCETQGNLTLSCNSAMTCTHATGHLELAWLGAQSFLLNGKTYSRE